MSIYIGVVCLVTKSCLTLLQSCGLKPGFSVHGISEARILEWVVILFTRESSQPRDQTYISCIDSQMFYHSATRESLSPRLPPSLLPSLPLSLSLSLYIYIYIYTHTHTHTYIYCVYIYLTLCNPMNWRSPGSSARGIFQARILEWVAISFSNL